jgi:putative ABC transport system permease protein
MLQDIRFGLRLIRKYPLPVGITIGGLALSIGVVASVFSMVDASMLRHYGMDEPSSVVSVTRALDHRMWPYWPYAQFLEMRDGSTLSTVEAALSDKVRFSGVSGGEGMPGRRILFVSGGYLKTLGGRPSAGRALEPSDDAAGAPPVIVVSHHLWSTELNRDPLAIGRTVWLNGSPVTLVGVLQPDFTGPTGVRPSIWAPFAAVDDVLMGRPFDATTRTLVEVVARLAPGAAARAAEANLTAIVNRSNAAGAAPGRAASQFIRLYSAASPIDGPDGAELYVAMACIFGVLALVLALACANTANLLLAVATTRMREIGVRLALGSTTGRLIRQMVGESLLLGLIAGGFGFLFAIWFVPILAAMIEMPPEFNAAPDGRALLFTTLVALVCGLGGGIWPARYGARGNVLSALQSQPGAGGTGVRSRLRATFVGFQAAVSMLLLVAAALLARTANVMVRADIGFDADRLLAVSFSAPRTAFDEPAYVRTALSAVRDVPLVERVTVTQYRPFGGSVERDRFTHDGRSYTLYVNRTDAGYFATAGVRLLRGRAFTAEEAAAEAPVALISDSVARTFFRGTDPLGQSLSALPEEGAGRAPATIIGVVSDVLMWRLRTRGDGAIYLPISHERSNPPSLLIRTANPHTAARAIEDALRPIDSRVRPTTSVVRDEIEAYIGEKRMVAWLSGPTAVLALVLAALGVYGVTAFVVSQRTQEISVRIAIGASAGDVLRLLVTDGLRPVIAGLVVGLALALAVSRPFASELPRISPYDPVAIGLAVMTLLTCALVAVVVPAQRAARTDPAAVLRRT